MKVVGKAYVIINGEKLDSKPGASLMLGGDKRTAQMGVDRMSGFSEEVEAAEIECTLNVNANTDLEAIKDFTDGTVTFLTDGGQTWVVNEAFCEGGITLNSKGDGATVKFIGQPAVRS